MSYLSRLELINKCNQNVAVPTVIFPKPSRVNKQGQFPQIAVNAAVEAFKSNAKI